MTPVIEVEGLVKRFGDHTAVDRVSFTVAPGEVFGLLGPNGAGKTTILRILTTLLRPSAGRVRILGLELGRHDDAIRRLLGYVPQALSADGSLSGRENLLVVAKLLGLPKAERERSIDRILHLLRLEDAADRLVRTYSGGMIRRLEIGQALLQTPRVLVLDEPTVGLDPTARRAIWEALAALRAESGLTLLVTTHYMEEADNACERLAILARGRIVALDTPANLKRAIGRPEATLEDVFTALTGDTLEGGGGYREHRQLRRRQRLG
jgi:ABC-2 type transport system ATP-binding protein